MPAAGSGLYASYGRSTVPAGFADGSYTVDLLADDQIEMRYSDELATTATYTLGGGLSRISVLLNSGGGGSTAEQTASGGLLRTSILTSPNSPFPLHTTSTGMALSEGNENLMVFAQVLKTNVRVHQGYF